MKLMDEKGRLFGKLNIFDLLLILVLAAGIAGMVFRLAVSPVKDNQTVSAVYKVEFMKLDECYVSAFSKGDVLYERGVALGTVADVQVHPSSSIQLQADGAAKSVEHVMYYDIELTIETDQLRISNGYYIEKNELLAGTSHIFSNGYASATGVIREWKTA